MSTDSVTNLRDTIIPKSDQLNADQLLGGEITITVTSVSRSGDEQPVVIHYEGENGRPFKPCKSCRKVLIFAWGEDGSQWIGRSMTLYNKRDVKWGGVEVGGIRISHLSHIRSDIQLSLAETKGKKGTVIVKRLDMGDGLTSARATLDTAARQGMDALKVAWTAVSGENKRRIGGNDGCPEAYKAIARKADVERAMKESPPTVDPAEERQHADAAARAAVTPPGPEPERGAATAPFDPNF
jgi:hypothetical protein